VQQHRSAGRGGPRAGRGGGSAAEGHARCRCAHSCAEATPPSLRAVHLWPMRSGVLQHVCMKRFPSAHVENVLIRKAN